MKFSKWMLAIGFIFGLSVSSFPAMLLFTGNAYFNQMAQMDLSNVVVAPNGSDQLFLKTSALIIDLYPTYKDKGLLATMKLKIDPYKASSDSYLRADGFSMIYDSEKFDYALFANRFGFRFKDPMMTGLDQYESDYVYQLYDIPQVFSYNGKVRTPAFYALDKDTQKFNDMAFLRAGKGLSGIYLSMDDVIGYEIAAFANQAQGSYQAIGDLSFKMDGLKAGALVRYQAFNGNSSGAAITRSTSLIYNGLMAQYNDFSTALSLGTFVKFNMEGLFGVFGEARVQLPKGTAGSVTGTNNGTMIEVYAGAGTPLALGDVEVSALYRMVTNSSRMEVSLKDYNAVDIDVAQIFLLGSFTYMNDTLLIGYTNSAILATLSMRASMLDDFLSFHVAADFSQQDLAGTEYSEVLFKTALAQNDIFVKGLHIYEGLTGLVLLNSAQRPTEKYYDFTSSGTNGTTSTNQALYLLPVAGVSYVPLDNFTLSLTYGYDIFAFGYDYDGVSHESEMSSGVTPKSVSGTAYKYVESWYKTFVNPTINVNASLKF